MIITKELDGYKINIEIWPEVNFRGTYNAYAFCPIEDCKRQYAFEAPRSVTEKKAAGTAFGKVKKHYNSVHKK